MFAIVRRVLYVRLLRGSECTFCQTRLDFLVMKCFIDSVVQEATLCFIIIVMMADGFLKKRESIN